MSQCNQSNSAQGGDDTEHILSLWDLDPQSLFTNIPHSCSTITSISSNTTFKSSNHISVNSINNKIRDKRTPFKPITNTINSNNDCSKDNYSTNISLDINVRPPKLDAIKQYRCKSDAHSSQFNRNLKLLYGYNSNTFMTNNLNVLSEYDLLDRIGSGSYGKVFKAKSKRTKQIVAIKKLDSKAPTPKDIENNINKKQNNDLTLIIREIMCLKNCHHANINKLFDVVVDKESNNLCFILEYVPNQLYTLMQKLKTLHNKRKAESLPTFPNWFSVANIKSIIWDILCGLTHLKKRQIIHRDLKPQNLLVTNNGDIQICDFGLSRNKYNNNELLTNDRKVVTRWYRAPEILIEQYKKKSYYGFPSDMWSVGAIFAELIIGKAIFNGDNDLHQILKIIEICGSINKNNIENIDMKSFLQKLQPKYKNMKCKLSEILGSYMNKACWTRMNIEYGLDLINKMLCYNPSKRITAQQALTHQWFQASPVKNAPTSLIVLCQKRNKRLVQNQYDRNGNNDNRQRQCNYIQQNRHNQQKRYANQKHSQQFCIHQCTNQKQNNYYHNRVIRGNNQRIINRNGSQDVRNHYVNGFIHSNNGNNININQRGGYIKHNNHYNRRNHQSTESAIQTSRRGNNYGASWLSTMGNKGQNKRGFNEMNCRNSTQTSKSKRRKIS